MSDAERDYLTAAEAATILGLPGRTVRNRLLRRALSFQPQAVVANGDHVYWDLRSPLTSKLYGASEEAEKIAGRFDRANVVLGGDNETVLKRAAGPQIAPIYGADFRSTPVFFNTAATRSRKFDCASCRAVIGTTTWSGGRWAASVRQRRAWLHASPSAHVPTSRISPVSSSAGMNSRTGTAPRCGSSQCKHVRTPASVPSLTVRMGS